MCTLSVVATAAIKAAMRGETSASEVEKQVMQNPRIHNEQYHLKVLLYYITH